MPYPLEDDPLAPIDTFLRRHIGPGARQTKEMLDVLGYASLDALTDEAVPAGIHAERPLTLAPPRGEHELIAELKQLASKNRVLRSYIGMGYHGTITPAVIQRNILENPGWYTQYTPYQAEISQGRLEALFNFQTMISDLTGLPVSNSSLLDEATAAAEAMGLAYAASRQRKKTFFVAQNCHPQTIAVVQTRAEALGIEVVVGDPLEAEFDGNTCGAVVQYPATDGRVFDYAEVGERIHAAGGLFIVAADLMSLVLLKSPASFGADMCVGSSQRFGVPMGYGGPHAAFLSTTEKYKRSIPGRIIGLSKDSQGNPALRLALQTREQHIRREKATSNICTAQVLLAVMAGMYGVYHGPDGLRRIAGRINAVTNVLAAGLEKMGLALPSTPWFDTLRVEVGDADAVMAAALDRGINLRKIDDRSIGVSLDETVTESDLDDLFAAFAPADTAAPTVDDVRDAATKGLDAALLREDDFLTHPVFHRYHAETEMLRYMHRLQGRDLSLVQSMISLGSCTMKLNGTSEMVPVTWPEFGGLHPFVPRDQAQGYTEMFEHLEAQLAEITGFHSISLQPNAGAQGEYTGLLVIRAYHKDRGEGHRHVCLIPASAHGTNPASAVMAGMKVVVVKCNEQGDICVDDLKEKAEKHSDDLAALMVTYPSTHGVFETQIREVCDIVHQHGGQVYLDGANMNAQVGVCRPGEYGADVCHLNLHKTFCIPHGGGGPGMGPIGVMEHLTPFLPGHPVVDMGLGDKATGPVSAAPWGSPSILPISYVYILLMGDSGLLEATQMAILNANYMAKRLEDHFPVLYRGPGNLNAHEFILDFRGFEKSAGITVEDVAKRLMDYGFHAPTMSFPVAGTLMVEPTESESKMELDRFCDAMIAIRKEIAAVESGDMDAEDNPLKNAPHTSEMVTTDTWSHPYTREVAAFPAPWVKGHKFWPPVARIDNVYGDRNLICACPPIEEYESA
jgi:glycine dehydrogenase